VTNFQNDLLTAVAVNDFLFHDEQEKQLLSLVREGDVKAFEKIYNSYAPRLYANISKLVKSTTITEELLQDTFQRVWEHRRHIDTEKCFRAYTSTIARNLVYDYFNKASRQRLLERYLQARGEKLAGEMEHRLEAKESASLFDNAIKQLPPQRKLIYTLCKIEGRSYEDVSKTLGISESTISDHIVKATKSIKAYYLSKDFVYKSIILLLVFFNF
jgi:RNA polymerase sigma-70 factor (ECF subfamily)